MGGHAQDRQYDVHDEDDRLDPTLKAAREEEEIVHMRGAAGHIWPMALPLHPDIAHQYAKGELVRVNEDGSPWEPSDDDPELVHELPRDRMERERAAAVEYARLKQERPDEDPIVLRDEAAELAGDRIPEAAVQQGNDVPGRRGGVVHGDYRDENLELLDADQVHPDGAHADEHVDVKPAQSATKAEWVDYAVDQGEDRAEAEKATKADLVKKFG